MTLVLDVVLYTVLNCLDLSKHRVNIVFLAVTFSFLEDSIYCLKPPCFLFPEDKNESSTNLLVFVTFVTPNQTVYANETAVFRIDINRTESKTVVPGLTAVAYVDGDVDTDHCELEEEETKVSRVCTFSGVVLSDNRKEVHFFLLAPQLGVQVCYEPPAYLFVKGPPLRVCVILVIDPCVGVILNIPDIAPDTDLMCRLYSNNELLYENTCNSSAVIPPKVLRHRPGEYILEVLPSNPAGSGEPTSENFSLKSSLINFKVSEISTRAGHMNNFFADIKLKVNKSCILTISDHVHISSSCSIDRVYEVNISEITADSCILFSHPLFPNRRNCTFHITDSGGNIATNYTNQSTFHTQNFKYSIVQEKYLKVTCRLIRGSTAIGCIIRISSIDSNSPSFWKVKRGSNGASIARRMIGPLYPNAYTLSVFDLMEGGQHDDSLEVFKAILFTIKDASTTTQSVFSTTRSISTVIMSNTPDGDGVKPTKSTEHVLAPGEVAMIVVFSFALVVMAAVIAVIVILVWKNKCQNKCGTYSIHLPIPSILQGNQRSQVPAQNTCTSHDNENEDTLTLQYEVKPKQVQEEERRRDVEVELHTIPIRTNVNGSAVDSRPGTAEAEINIENSLTPVTTEQPLTVTHEDQSKQKEEEAKHPSESSSQSTANQLKEKKTSDTSSETMQMPLPNNSSNDTKKLDEQGQKTAAKLLGLPGESAAVPSIPPPRCRSKSTGEDAESSGTPTSSLNLAQIASLKKVHKDQAIKDAFTPTDPTIESVEPSDGQEGFVPPDQYGNNACSTLTTTDSETAPFFK